jgi:hypothetical protein
VSPRRVGLDRLRRRPPSGRHGEATIDVSSLISDNLTLVVGALALVALVCLLAVVWLARRITALETRLALLTRGGDGTSLETILGQHLGTVERVAADVDSLGARTASLERDTRLAVQRVGFVRFNPFEDTGGNQSFALALLDANDDGLVVSSLHARNGTRIYAKSISTGRAEAALSDEETDALRLAMNGRASSLSGDRRGA